MKKQCFGGPMHGTICPTPPACYKPDWVVPDPFGHRVDIFVWSVSSQSRQAALTLAIRQLTRAKVPV